MLTQDVRHLSLQSKMIWTGAKNLRKQNIEQAGEVREKDARTTVESARIKALTEELATVNAKLVASRVNSASFC